jgi:xylulokinase
MCNQISDRVACMNSEIETVPVGSDGVVFIPHLRGSIVPHRMPAARGGFLGLREIHSRAHMARAIYEGLAMEFRLIVDRLGQHLKVHFPDIRCFGGGSQNAAWVQIKADVLNKPVVVYQTRENACLGAAILAGVGCGLYSSIEDAFAQILHQTSMVEPEPEAVRRYASLYGKVYEKMFEHLREINALIQDNTGL